VCTKNDDDVRSDEEVTTKIQRGVRHIDISLNFSQLSVNNIFLKNQYLNLVLGLSWVAFGLPFPPSGLGTNSPNSPPTPYFPFLTLLNFSSLFLRFFLPPWLPLKLSLLEPFDFENMNFQKKVPP